MNEVRVTEVVKPHGSTQLFTIHYLIHYKMSKFTNTNQSDYGI